MSVSLICAGQTLNFVKICICEFTSVYDSCTRNQALRYSPLCSYGVIPLESESWLKTEDLFFVIMLLEHNKNCSVALSEKENAEKDK